MLSSACRAVAAAERIGGPALDWMPGLPPVLAEFTMFQPSHGTGRAMFSWASSSSATIWARPVVTPLPTSIWLVLNTTELSGRTDSHESTWVTSGRYPVIAPVGTVADALPASSDPP